MEQDKNHATKGYSLDSTPLDMWRHVLVSPVNSNRARLIVRLGVTLEDHGKDEPPKARYNRAEVVGIWAVARMYGRLT